MAGQIWVHHSVIDRHMQRLQAAGMIDERAQSGRSRKTILREDRQIARCVRKHRFQLVLAR